ncbi:MAG: peptide ABC transporter substrate-binding protein [Planctomycetota bacterium]
MHRAGLKLAIAAGILAALGAACGRTGPAGAGGGVPAAAPRAILVMVINAEPKTLDPAYITDMVSIRVAAGLLEGLTVLNEETLAPEPGVAESWTVSPDGLIYTFRLRPALWSDGSPMTADDFIRSWRRVLDPATAADYAYMLFHIRNAAKFNRGECPFEEVGLRSCEGGMEVTLERPTAFFLDLTAFVTYLPVPGAAVAKHGEAWTRPENFVGNGPFLLARHAMHDRLVLAKNPRYHAAADVKLDELVLRVMEDTTVAFNEYDAGGVDIITSVPVNIYRNIRDLHRTDLHVFTTLGTYFVRFNVTRPPFNDVRVRRAFALAIDRSFITARVTEAGEIPADGLTPAGTARRPAMPAAVRCDPATACGLMEQAGFPQGRGFPRVEYLFNTNEDHKRIANYLTDTWKKTLGVEAVPVNMEWKSYLDATKALDFALARSVWNADINDPINFLELFISGNPNNRTGWSNAEYDRLLAAAGAEGDAARRTELLAGAEQLLAMEMPVIPLHYMVSMFMYRDRVGGIHPNPLNWVRPGRLHLKPPTDARGQRSEVR